VAYQHLPVFTRTLRYSAASYRAEPATAIADALARSTALELKDSAGRAHPVIADVDAATPFLERRRRRRVLTSTTGAALEFVHFRLEFAHESEAQVHEVVRAFDLTLKGSMTPRKLGENCESSRHKEPPKAACLLRVIISSCPFCNSAHGRNRR